MIRNLKSLQFMWNDTLTLFKQVEVEDERQVTNYEEVEVKIRGKLLQTSMHNDASVQKDGLTYEVDTKRKFICDPNEKDIIAGLRCIVRDREYITGDPFVYPTHLEIPLRRS